MYCHSCSINKCYMQSTTLLCRLLERCGCPCEAKIEEAQGQFLLYIHEEHTAADHKDNSSRYLSVNMQDFISKAVKTAPTYEHRGLVGVAPQGLQLWGRGSQVAGLLVSVTRQAGLGGGCYLFLLVVVLARQRTLAALQRWVLTSGQQPRHEGQLAVGPQRLHGAVRYWGAGLKRGDVEEKRGVWGWLVSLSIYILKSLKAHSKQTDSYLALMGYRNAFPFVWRYPLVCFLLDHNAELVCMGHPNAFPSVWRYPRVCFLLDHNAELVCWDSSSHHCVERPNLESGCGSTHK